MKDVKIKKTIWSYIPLLNQLNRIRLTASLEKYNY